MCILHVHASYALQRRYLLAPHLLAGGATFDSGKADFHECDLLVDGVHLVDGIIELALDGRQRCRQFIRLHRSIGLVHSADDQVMTRLVVKLSFIVDKWHEGSEIILAAN